MKPRNKFEEAVLEQSKHLRPITTTQSKWAFRECIDHFAYRLPKGRTTLVEKKVGGLHLYLRINRVIITFQKGISLSLILSIITLFLYTL